MKDYFFGRYFKCSSKDGTIAIIHAFHKTNGVTTSSIQLISDEGAWSFPFDYKDYSSDGFNVTIKNNSFRKDGISFDLEGDNIKAYGNITFSDFNPIKGDIMGPFKYVPFMECRHSVYSVYHKINGSVTINDKTYNMDDGIGYIEGDRGRSFPKVYSWTQTSFLNGSLMLSVASIPFCIFKFIGVIGFVWIDGKEYRIATYKGAKAKYIKDGTIKIKQGKLEFSAELIEKHAHPLYAPKLGAMVRTIKESATCVAHYKLKIKNEVILDLKSESASFEYEFKD